MDSAILFAFANNRRRACDRRAGAAPWRDGSREGASLVSKPVAPDLRAGPGGAVRGRRPADPDAPDRAGEARPADQRHPGELADRRGLRAVLLDGGAALVMV